MLKVSSATPKDPKNQICQCGSKKKAKHCCLKGLQQIPLEYKSGQENSSEQVAECIIKLKTRFLNHRIIDITEKLTETSYKPFQIANYNDPTIMIAEKTESNTQVFTTRTESTQSNIIVMYHGSYRTFPFDYFDKVFESVCAMIK